MEISYKTRGTCSRSIHITLSDDGAYRLAGLYMK